jgi:hypothetical protein
MMPQWNAILTYYTLALEQSANSFFVHGFDTPGSSGKEEAFHTKNYHRCTYTDVTLRTFTIY